jgi:hypothetical protein
MNNTARNKNGRILYGPIKIPESETEKESGCARYYCKQLIVNWRAVERVAFEEGFASEWFKNALRITRIM